MRVIAKKVLRDFWKNHQDCEGQLKAWYREVENGQWKSPNAIKVNYPTASILAENRLVFNIIGNKYRVVVRINYDYGVVWIRFIGSHQEYNKINVLKV